MLKNELYTNRRLNQAIIKDGKINTNEQKGWFYKAWNKNKVGDTPDLEEPVFEEELAVRDKMEQLRLVYRERHEKIRRVFPPAHPFNGQKKAIERSAIFRVFRKMPKCGLLHIHGAAALSIEGLMALLKQWDGIPMYVVFNNKKYPEGSLVYDTTGLQKEAFEEVKSFLKDEENEYWLMERLSMCSPERTAAIPYIWDEFNDIFLRTSELFGSREFYYRYHKRALDEMREDKIDYVELRCGYQDFRKDRDTNESPIVAAVADAYKAQRERADSFETRLEDIFEQSFEFLHLLLKMSQAEKVEKNMLEIRVILCARRDLEAVLEESKSSVDKLKRKTDYALLLKKIPDFKDFLLGFDYVSEEDRGKTTYSYYHRVIYGKFGQDYLTPEREEKAITLYCTLNGIPELKDAYLAEIRWNPVSEQEILEDILGESDLLRIRLIDFYLHDGESSWYDDDNIVNAAICSRNRVGHGFSMNRFQTLIHGEQVYQAAVNDQNEFPYIFPEDADISVEDARGLVLEICPISNQMLRYFPDLRNHTGYELMKQGIPCVLGNDDPQLLGNPGLTYDFWEAYVGMGLSMGAVKGLVFNSYACKRKIDEKKEMVTPADYSLWIAAFNKVYWEPFIREAAGILHI